MEGREFLFMLDLDKMEEEFYALDDYHSYSDWVHHNVSKLILEIEKLRDQVSTAFISGYSTARKEIQDRSHA